VTLKRSYLDRWLPHLRPKVKKITRIEFEDGSALDVRHIGELRAYLKCLEDEEYEAFNGMSREEARRLGRAVVAAQMAEIAQGVRRTNVTAEAVAAFRDRFTTEHQGRSRGWKTAAAQHFNCSLETITNRTAG